jgi:hypothetical protein
MAAEHLTGPEIRETAAGEFLQGLLCGLACYADSHVRNSAPTLPPHSPAPPPLHIVYQIHRVPTPSPPPLMP